MSGLEVAGVVLGAIPLLISGLEHYAEGVSTIKRMFKAPGEIRKLCRILRTEQSIFCDTIEHLLSDCVDDVSLQNLLNDVGGDSWSEPAVDAALRKKLRGSYEVYIETVEDMMRTLSTFRERLQLGDDGKGPTTDPNSLREARKRFMFGIRQADYTDLLDEIIKDNRRLGKLIRGRAALEAQKTRRRIPDFTKIRNHAESMFSTLQTGLRGSCKASHRASLCMRSLEPGPGISQDDEHSFRIVLHHDFKAPQLPSQWVIEEAEVRMLDAMVVASSNPPAFSSPPTVISKGKKSLRFQDPPGPTSVPVTALKTAQQQSLDEIKDLCESIQKLRTSKCGICLGYLQDQVNAGRHGIYWPKQPLVDRKTLTSVSLGSLLADSSQQPKARLSVADSRRLALALALGVLRLHDTPWLAEQWNRDDITLFKQNNMILATHPFVSTDLQTIGTQKTKGSPAIRNETLFALGIVLIELCMEQSFDALYLPEDLNVDGSKHAISDFLAANRLVDQVYDRGGKRYGDAVRRCISCDFDQRRTTLEDDAFRRAVYDNVVAVLEEDLAQFLGL